MMPSVKKKKIITPSNTIEIIVEEIDTLKGSKEGEKKDKISNQNRLKSLSKIQA